ncbi:MAG: SAM-dependent methyltransferase, partial [Chloroflexota bacterium]
KVAPTEEGAALGNLKVAPTREGPARGDLEVDPTGEDAGVEATFRPPATFASGTIVALLKPQFEATRAEVPRGGVIRDPLLHSRLIGRFAAWCVTNGFRIRDMVASPILGDAGNREFLFWLQPGSPTRPRQGAASSAPTGASPTRPRLGAASSAPTERDVQ